MTRKRTYNITGMDQSNGLNSDALWYLRDATILGPNSIKSRPRLPSKQFSANSDRPGGTGTGVWGSFDVVGSSGNSVAGFASKTTDWGADGAPFVIYNNGVGREYVDNVSGGAYQGLASGTDKLFHFTKNVNGTAKLDRHCFFWHRNEETGVGSHIAVWSGSIQTAHTEVATADTFAASKNIAQGTGLANSYFGLDTGTVVGPFRIDQVSGVDTKTANVAMASTTSNRNMASFPYGLVSDFGGTIFDTTSTPTPYSYEGTAGAWVTTSMPPIAYAACGHQGRLFISNGNEIRYSGVESDVVGVRQGFNYWDADSVFEVAPETGERIEHMASVNGDLIIFKDTGICVLRGVVANGDPSELGASVTTLSSTIRCESNRSVVVTPLGAVLLSPDGIYLVSGEGVQSIGEQVWPYLSSAFVHNSGVDNKSPKYSFLADSKVYFQINTTTETSYEVSASDTFRFVTYIVWDLLNGSWQVRTFNKNIAPCDAGQIHDTTDHKSSTIFFPINSSGFRFTAFSGSETTGITAPDGITLAYSDRPQFCLITAPVVSDNDYPGHCRVRNIFVNGYEDGNVAAESTVGSVNNQGASFYVGGLILQTNSVKSSAYTIGDTDESWSRHPIASDEYGWSKSAIIGVTDSLANAAFVSDLYINGVCVEYDESDVGP